MIQLTTLTAAALARTFEHDDAFTHLVDAVEEITRDRDLAETEAEAIVAVLARPGVTPEGTAAPRRHVRFVTHHGVRVAGRCYSGSFLLGHVGHAVAVETARDADRPECRLAIVRTVETGILLGTAHVAEETLAPAASPMLRRVRFELDTAA